MVALLVVTKGHPFDKGAFAALVDGLDGVETTHVEHPAAQHVLNPAAAADYDAILFYDMPGYRFRLGEGVDIEPPPPALVDGIEALLRQGKGMVFLHHALAGWAAWERYGRIIGGRFLYQPGVFAGQQVPDSGYRHDVTYTAEVVADHPVTAGLPATFEVTDELYSAHAYTADVVPLVRARHAFTAEHFYSADAAVHGRMFSNEGWHHPGGTDLIAWAKAADASPIVYLQCGDGPAAYGNPQVRTLLGNAIQWVTSPAARAWAASRRQP
jgi:type 1 glutamine amidotransferase